MKERWPFSSEPSLLISVVNGREARAALAGGADIIDLKNPLEGPLGAPAPKVIEEVCGVVKGHKPFSIALGEFPGKPGAAALAALGGAYFQPDFLKIAFLAHTPSEEMVRTLKEIKSSIGSLPHQKTSQIVSVAFADTIRSGSWNLADFAAFSQEGGAAGCLIDTWEKNGSSLLDYFTGAELGEFIESCHTHELFCGLAGALKFSHIPLLSRLKPELIGVRSAVCGGDRLGGTVSCQSVRELKELCGQTEHEKADKHLA
ncbi:(5-formylfuran-3-yl)methyl phosphate synthase [Candidatus Formimonas warabiya]|uniref:(5-formylfuran-3-yl)methyl phosphate synthase n=1 Tax=Formimonas warabiya TaxID=1761012 RepID=A0A3G1KNK8_FORW1|nr:(5-formylfuran-3-yl)methyl phosphate synthase [Candidatus Formimonas warabiya]ATW24049.1 hypothetical protein DCMF_03930 [Candidatus Formimonas warabiya]